MQINILDASTLGDDVNLKAISDIGNVKVYDTTAPCELSTHCIGADVLILNKVRINSDTLPDSGNIRLICVTATGYDNVSLEYCRERGIALCNVKAYSTDSVAQLAILMALYLNCHIRGYTRYVRDMSYTKSGIQNCLKPAYHELSGKRWGVIGCGAIGTKVGRIAEALGCEVVVYQRSNHPDFDNIDIDTLVSTSDIISVHTPLTDETRNLISRDRIFSMKKDAIFINLARGAVADESALCDAILNKSIAGIGIDVYSTEPFDENHPYTGIMHMDNVCLTPHMAWGAVEARQRCIDEIVLNINAFYNNQNRNRIV